MNWIRKNTDILAPVFCIGSLVVIFGTLIISCSLRDLEIARLQTETVRAVAQILADAAKEIWAP